MKETGPDRHDLSRSLAGVPLNLLNQFKFNERRTVTVLYLLHDYLTKNGVEIDNGFRFKNAAELSRFITHFWGGVAVVNGMSSTFDAFKQKLKDCKFIHSEKNDIEKLVWRSLHFQSQEPNYKMLLWLKRGNNDENEMGNVQEMHPDATDALPPEALLEPSFTLNVLSESIHRMQTRSDDMSTMTRTLKENADSQVADLVIVRQRTHDLDKRYTAQSIECMLVKGIGRWAPDLRKVFGKTIVEFSCPCVGREMSYKQFRSTVFGDTIACILGFAKVEATPTIQVVDWGVEFGSLIIHLFGEKIECEGAEEMGLADFQLSCREARSKLRKKREAEFHREARNAQLLLEGGDPRYQRAWSSICALSNKCFKQIYDLLGVSPYLERSVTFYNPYIRKVLKELKAKKLVKKKDLEDVMVLDGYESDALILTRKDGNHSFDATYLAALWHRLKILKADSVIYVTDAERKLSFEILFMATRHANWHQNSMPGATFMGLGTALPGDYVNGGALLLLENAKSECLALVTERAKNKEWSADQVDQLAGALGYGAVKYADLMNNRENGYEISVANIVRIEGNTGVGLQFALAGIAELIRECEKEDVHLVKTAEVLKSTEPIVLLEEAELTLGHQLIGFRKAVEEACVALKPDILCTYMYLLSQAHDNFCDTCPIRNTMDIEIKISRLLLSQATLVVLRQCFLLLKIKPVVDICSDF